MKNNAGAIKREKLAKAGRITKKTFIYAFLVLWALIVLFPFYWMLLTSVKSYGAYNSEYIPKFFTLSPTFENYRHLRLCRSPNIF